ncbi:HlyD family efflux transporter periplasmic adaptor subunit [Xanthomonas prunicola]|nr:HlyD family efflux transporter periplasmic adaptor subunit [Xanthomonas prunicola]USI99510.1 HlyD family efflux transporter periplasmic adaptor subunit [Xanthomonas prunicola]UXA47961.1 HlyD family efflux transporter periplasmic adaptor subunit [Xanthomonas prunicola]UXA62382.1 HlyD family efflux transporter periplasmic adaptor subunit [Xanthomonas prunicola]UXA68173.1 HlyD family efflux transporter periplasmic adaptor subunit [Xanthomonas prunicola]
MTGKSLFRREVYEARQEDWVSSAVLVAPRAGWIAALLGCLAVSTVVLVIFFGRYTQHVTAAGRLVPSRGLLTLTSTEAGEVVSLHVRQGESVKEGQIVAKISGELNSASMGGTYASVSTQLRDEKDRLRSDLEANEKAFETQQQLLEGKIGSLTSQLRHMERQAILRRQYAEINQQLLEKMEPLKGTGYISTVQLIQQRGALLEQQTQLSALGAQDLVTRQQLEEIRSELVQLPSNVATKRNAIRSKLAGIEQTLVQNEARRAYVIRAPRDGFISALMIEEGQTVQGGQPIITEMPANSEMQAQLFVSSRRIGFIRLGSSVLLRLQAFPYQDFGQARGVVCEISHSALSPDDLRRLTGKQFDEPQYQVKVSLNRRSIGQGVDNQLFLPGMVVEASIMLRERRLLEWLFEPIQDLKWSFQ